MKLYFVRHAKASRVAPSDELRPLDKEGIEQAEHIGRALAALAIKPVKIYTSPRLRAQETARLIGTALGVEPEIHDACNFDFTAAQALEIAAGHDEEDEVMFVGHNPSMSEVVEEISGAQVDLSTGAVACVMRVHPPHSSGAILKWLLTPKVVTALLK